MEEINGRKSGTIIYVYDDYTYNKDSRNPNILRCNTRRSTNCFGTLKVDKDGKIHLVQDHTHVPIKWKVRHFIMKQEMLQLCRDTSLPLKEIFDSVCRKYPEAATTLSYATLKTTLYRERIKLRQTLPKDMETLATNLSTYQPLEKFYKGNVTCSDGKKALIFTSNELLQELQKSTELYVDGTFNIVPRVPLMNQMYTLHTRYMNVGIAMIFILCESRSSNMYRAIWNKILELVPMLQHNVKFIMSDYETAAMKVINEQFPAAAAHGCWFHYNQALLRHWRRLGLMDAPRNILSMTMSMALVPSDCFEEALSFIQFEVDQISHEYPAVNDFLTYVRKTWLPLASKVSVYDCPVRTNNITETFHNIAGRKFSKSHENVWSFLDNLRILITDEEIKLKRLKTTETTKHYTTIKNRNRDNKILKMQNYFATGRLDLNNFLRFFNDKYENMIKDKLLSNETKSNTLHNIEDDTKINTKRKTPLQTLNYEEMNHSRTKYHKRRQNNVLNTDKENFNREHKNTQKQDILKLPELKVILQRIDKVSKKEIKISSKESLKKRRRIRI
ncbi:uncharacterized protein [Linepithema humile]|uniref:uncharacterized protein isoform X2 n=1 Tax=Linepithema humile TaxID=83485 RepID=UPI00351EEE20